MIYYDNNKIIGKMYKGTTPVRKMYGGTSLSFNNGIESLGGAEPPTPSYDTQYLTFEALESGTFSFSGYSSASANTLQYSVDSGTTWTTIGTNTNTPTVQSGKKIMWKGSNLIMDYNNGPIHFMSSGNFDVEGNVMSLVNGDDFATATTISNENQFRFLFRNCAKLISAENMVLPATTLAQGCYSSMFIYCTSLTTAPELPATTLASSCYSSMFYGCTNLTTAPQLPATTLANNCYFSMFNSCTSLTTAPQLPATTLADGCYYNMFYGCTGLTAAPELPATTLAYYCYQEMFEGCTSLTTAPELPATTLADYCYWGMFSGCTSLTAITCLATDISANYCTYDWVNGVASTGTFTSAVGMADWQCGNNGIPTDWTVVGGEPCQEGGYLEININGRRIDGADCGTPLPRYIVYISAPSIDRLAFSSSPCAHYVFRLDMRSAIPPIDLYEKVGGRYEAYISEEGCTLRGDNYTVILSDDPNA